MQTADAVGYSERQSKRETETLWRIECHRFSSFYMDRGPDDGESERIGK